MAYIAHSRFAHDNAVDLVGEVCRHLATHDFDIDGEGSRWIIKSGYGTCDIEVDGPQAVVTVKASTPTGIAVLKEQVAGHLIEASPDMADRISWSGDNLGSELPVWFCLISVLESRRLTPHMQRITFKGKDLHRYDGMQDIHVRLMLPTGDGEREWPRVDPNGMTRYPDPEILAIRKYTVRRIDPIAETVEIDFVLHEDAGPGSRFAMCARLGDVIGMAGPGGRSAPLDRDWYLLAGDETALPAMARILENLPAKASGVALIEVADENEQIELPSVSGVEITWLFRQRGARGSATHIKDAIESVRFPADSSIYAWVGCEHQTAMSVRQYLHKTRAIDKKDSLVVSYWRQAP